MHKWQNDCRAAIDRLCRAQLCILKKSSTIGEQLTRIYEHQGHLLSGTETQHDTAGHARVREAFQTLKDTFPAALTELNVALDTLEAGLPDECQQM